MTNLIFLIFIDQNGRILAKLTVVLDDPHLVPFSFLVPLSPFESLLQSYTNTIYKNQIDPPRFLAVMKISKLLFSTFSSLSRLFLSFPVRLFPLFCFNSFRLQGRVWNSIRDEEKWMSGNNLRKI